MTQSTPTFIEPSMVQSTFFDSLDADAREFYANIFASLRHSNRQWLALALYKWHKYGLWPEENRNPFMQSLFLAIVDAEDCAAFDKKCANLGAFHQSNLEPAHIRLKKWIKDKLTYFFPKI